MKHTIAATLLIGLAASGALRAQPPSSSQQPYAPIQTPTVSPYLNLRRPGNVANNYFGLVRPQLDFRNSIGQLQGGLATQQQSIAQLQEGGEIVTGHTARFLNTSPYFMNIGGAQGAGRIGTNSALPAPRGPSSRPGR